MADQVTCRVEGLVQGVGFRYFVYRKAVELGVKGWVRNHSDGSVELMAIGDRSILDDLVKAVRHGPRASIVKNLKTEWDSASTIPSSFDIL